jgi:imidazolonepropionase-like amidohydrolase
MVMGWAGAQDKPVVLRGGKVLTVTHGVIDNGAIVMEGGKITAVGDAGTIHVPAGARVIDVTGMTIYPGLIDSETQLGLTEISAEQTTNDLVELSDEIMPHMHTAEAFHAESALIPVARMNGITNAVIAPESADTLPGQDSFI